MIAITGGAWGRPEQNFFQNSGTVLGSEISTVMGITVERDALGKLDSVIYGGVKP